MTNSRTTLTNVSGVDLRVQFRRKDGREFYADIDRGPFGIVSTGCIPMDPNLFMYIETPGSYEIKVYDFLKFRTSTTTRKWFRVGETSTTTNIWIYSNDSNNAGGLDDTEEEDASYNTAAIDRITTNALILANSARDNSDLSEYVTVTSVTDAPFSAMFYGPASRVELLGRSGDHAFYVTLLVTADEANIVNSSSTPGLTLSTNRRYDDLITLTTGIHGIWTTHVKIS